MKQQFSDLIFWLLAAGWLVVRPWPYGGAIHITTDIVLSLAALATLYGYWRKSQDKRR